MKKILFLAVVVFWGVGFSFQALASTADCTDECSVNADCASGTCRTATCINKPAETVSVCSATTSSTTSSTSCKKQNDSCTTSDGKSGVCGSISSTSSGAGGTSSSTGWICWPKSSSSGTAGEGESCTTKSDCKTGLGLDCYLKAECKDGSCTDSICSTTTPTGTDYCSGGDCTLSVCTTARPSITGGSCGDSSKKCCQTEKTSTTSSDSCSGTCRSECKTGTETRSSNVSEYCGNDKEICCVTSNSTTKVTTDDSKKSGTAWNVANAGNYGLPSGTIAGIVQAVVSWALGIFGFLGIIAFVIAGLFYLTAAGDAEVEKKAKLAMKMGIIGIVVGLIGYVVIQAVDAMLNAGTSF